MLVLSRKSGERIRIGENIVLSIVRIRGNRVQIGIEAPADVVVDRRELRVPPEAEGPHRLTMAEFDLSRLA